MLRWSVLPSQTSLTGKAYKPTLVNASLSKIHMLQQKHPVDPELGFQIISQGGTREVINIKESIMIERLRPTLNERGSSAPLFLYA